MCLNVCLVYHIDTQLIAEFQKQRIRRIVRSSYGINIILLAQKHITLNFVRRHRKTIRTARIMVIDSAEFYLVPIQIVYSIFYLNVFKTDSLFHTGSFDFVIQIIKHRSFRIPLLHVQAIKLRYCSLVLRFHCHRFTDSITTQHESHTCILCQSHARQRPVISPLRLFRRLLLLRCFRFRAGIVLYLLRHHFLHPEINVHDIRLIQFIQQHVTENTVVTEHILCLQIGSRAPAMQNRNNFIFSVTNMFTYIIQCNTQTRIILIFVNIIWSYQIKIL